MGNGEREGVACVALHLAVGLTDVIWPQDSEARGSFVAQRRLPSTDSHSLKARCHSGWQARRWVPSPGLRELFPYLFF